jgi:hypothetical protein
MKELQSHAKQTFGQSLDFSSKVMEKNENLITNGVK